MVLPLRLAAIEAMIWRYFVIQIVIIIKEFDV